MELDKFISETLKGIIKGVKDSQDFANENGARVNPQRDSTPSSNKYVFYGEEDGIKMINEINFDIAVTVSNEQASGIEGGIKIYALSLGGKANDKDLNQTVSRLQFSIDVALPSVKA